MIKHFTRYALILIFLLFSTVFLIDYWYQHKQENALSIPLSETIETIKSFCQANTCSTNSTFGKVTILSKNNVHFPQSFKNNLNNNKVIQVSNDEGEIFAYANTPNNLQIIKYGPVTLDNANLNLWYTALFYLILALIIFAGLFPLFREMAKLKNSAENFSKTGELSDLPTDRSAFFRPVNIAFATMTAKIAQLLALQKELSDTLSHEIRTPLSRIRFAKEALCSENISQFKEDMELDLYDMESLVAEYLSFSRLEHEVQAIETQNKSPIPIVENHVLLFNKYTTKHVKLVFDSTSNRNIDINEKMFSRAIKNLIDNACKYANSTVIVTVKDIANENNVIILIEDDGPGIEKQQIDELFLPYTRKKKESISGYGLGLAITQKIILWHRGKISVAPSQNLDGACFCIQIPCIRQSNDIEDS